MKKEVENVVEVEKSELNLDDVQKLKIRNLLNSVYDIQKLRIATGNRIVQSFNIQMGQMPSTKQEDMEDEAKSMISQLKEEYKRIADAYLNRSFIIVTREGKNKVNKEMKVAANLSIEKVISQVKSTVEDDTKQSVLIKNKLDYKLVETYISLLDAEESTTKILQKEVEKHPLWDAFFKDVNGCGPLMAAVCIGYLDVNVARHVSSFWKYCGLDTVDVVKDDGTVVNEGRAAKHAKFTEVQYIDKDGNTQTKHGLGYNPVVKTKLVGVLGSCLLKAGLRTVKDEKGKPVLDANGNKQQTANGYAKIYLDYLNRLNNRADSDKLTPAHKHAMANRYMIKQFLRDLWVTWREMAGYEVSEPYEVEKLGYKPHLYNEYHDRVAKRTHEEHLKRA